jgi:hypothetical protein
MPSNVGQAADAACICGRLHNCTRFSNTKRREKNASLLTSILTTPHKYARVVGIPTDTIAKHNQVLCAEIAASN